MHLTTSIGQFVLKVHGRCDLACDHCYVYEQRDQSWREKAHSADSAVIRQAAFRIAEHAAEHGLASVDIVLHGGEPLLLCPRRLREAFEILYTAISPVARTNLRIHTNGVLLSPELCDMFARYRVSVGVSLDGDLAANDRHRRFADGRSSHDKVLRALELLRRPKYRNLYAGILCTVDVENDPIATLEALLAEKPPRIDFLLPHATWDNPPPRPPGTETAYADWLNQVFDRWVALRRPTSVRLFESIEAVAVGEASTAEGIGLTPVDLLVVETGGEWEQVDSLKTAYDGAPMLIRPADSGETDVLNVFDHSVDAAAAHPAVAARQHGAADLSDTCKSCELLERCGGGHYAHRYRTGSGFRNPSVYCEDLKALITHIGIPERTVVAEEPPVRIVKIDRADILAIADGPVDHDRARRFGWTQSALTRYGLAAIGDRASERTTSSKSAAADGWELLLTLDREAPEAVQAVLDHPFAQAWIKRCSGRLKQGKPFAPRDSTRMSALALAAAVRAGVDTALELPFGGRSIHLPTLGTLVRRASADRRAVVEVKAGRIDESTTDFEAWHPSTWIRVQGNSLLLEDLDPYRDAYGYATAKRLSGSLISQWQNTMEASLEILERWSSPYAQQVKSCVKAVVPLTADPTGTHRSEASSDAFGAIAAALPNGPDVLAMLLVHESQHLLLDTAFAADRLYDPADGRLFAVAWRADERPIDGVLQGAFAHIALAEVWMARHRANDGAARSARATASEYGAWSRIALDQLITHGALSPLGVSFAQSLNMRIRRVLKS